MCIDIGMLALMFTSFGYRFSGNRLHEVTGILLCTLFAAHTVMNRHWYRAILRGRYNLRRILATAINLSLLLAMSVTLVTAVPISRTAFAFLSVDTDLTLPSMHIMAANWAFILVSMHIGMHGPMIAASIQAHAGAGKKQRWQTGLSLAAIAAIAVCGVHASFSRGIGSKLIMITPLTHRASRTRRSPFSRTTWPLWGCGYASRITS